MPELSPLPVDGAAAVPEEVFELSPLPLFDAPVDGAEFDELLELDFPVLLLFAPVPVLEPVFVFEFPVLPVLLSLSMFFDGAAVLEGFAVAVDLFVSEEEEDELFVFLDACEALQFDLGCVPSTKYAFSLGQVLVAILPE